MSATIPITLTPVPVPTGVKATDINQLLTILTQYIVGSINTDVSFFQTVSSDPSTLTTPLIFNSSQQVFKYWSNTLGNYQAITSFQAGDVKSTFSSGDSPQTGWIECNGRLITDISNISGNQESVLNALFGVGGTLPDLRPLMGVSNLPATNAFSEIAISDVNPPADQIKNLPFSTDYNPVESQNLSANTETLRTSQVSLRDSVVNIRTISEQFLESFTLPTSGMITQIFVGYP